MRPRSGTSLWHQGDGYSYVDDYSYVDGYSYVDDYNYECAVPRRYLPMGSGEMITVTTVRSCCGEDYKFSCVDECNISFVYDCSYFCAVPHFTLPFGLMGK